MIKKFWLYRVKSAEKTSFELRETVMGASVMAKISRSIKDQAKKLSTLIRSLKILGDGKLRWDGLEVECKPPPDLKNDSSHQYLSLTEEEVKQVKESLGQD